MDDVVAVQLSHIEKSFKLPHERQNTLKSALLNFSKRGYERQEVLKDFSLTVKKGEFLGILGRNGSGKSTLLKTLSGIYAVDKGSVEINGKLTPFIELGVGFNHELSGRDNVYLNGALLGFSRSDIDVIYNEIVAFAELERFMDQKLKNYSSGMQVRLAFSIAIRANADILVLDEVLAVGDEAFQRKCYDYFNELKLKKKTVILVTHDMSAVQRFCTRAVVINKGEIIFDGETEKATEVYRNLNLESTERTIKNDNKKRLSAEKKDIIKDVKTLDEKGIPKTLFRPNERITIASTVQFSADIAKPALQFWFSNPGGTAITSIRIKHKELKNLNLKKPVQATWQLEGIYNDGKYLVTVEVSDEETDEVREVIKDGYEFEVIGWESPYVLVHPKTVTKVTQ